MKKLALIVTAGLVATGALAQTASKTSTEVYGRINSTIESQTVNGKTESAFQDNASRLGFRMKRTIDAGLSIGGTLEAAVNSSNGASAGTLFAREATLNVTGGFGRVRVGKLPAGDAYFNIVDAVSNHNHDTGTSSDQLSGFTTVGKFKNAIAYNGNTGAVSYGAAYGLRKNGNTDTAAVNASPLNLIAGYDAGPLSAGVAYEKYDQRKAFSVRASYKIGALLVGGYIESDSGKKTDISDGTGTTGVVTGENARTITRMSAMYTVGKSEYHANYGQAGSLANTSNTGGSQLTLGYNYNVDSAVKFYGFYTRVNNQSNGNNYSLNGVTTSGQVLSTLFGTSSSAIGAGVRYNF